MPILIKTNLEHIQVQFNQLLLGINMHAYLSNASMNEIKLYMQIMHYLTNSEIIKCDETCDKLTVEEVMSCIDGPET